MSQCKHPKKSFEVLCPQEWKNGSNFSIFAQLCYWQLKILANQLLKQTLKTFELQLLNAQNEAFCENHIEASNDSIKEL